ncbi:MAG: toll/interleukin-1 receptor domain-containing protein [Acidobacteriota bacterium]
MMKRIFLSHAARDHQMASKLAGRLREEGFDVFLQEELPAGANFALEVGRKLEKADIMVVLLSPDAVASSWVQREIEYALTSRRLKGRLVPVQVRPTKDIPWILRHLNFLDLRGEEAGKVDKVVAALKEIDDAA